LITLPAHLIDNMRSCWQLKLDLQARFLRVFAL